MHLRRVYIRNVRSIAELTWELPPEVSGAGWHVVDEIDAHLHPSWQRTIGVWFRRHFPNVQFVPEAADW